MAVDLDPVLNVLGEIQFPQDGPENGLRDDRWGWGRDGVPNQGYHQMTETAADMFAVAPMDDETEWPQLT